MDGFKVVVREDLDLLAKEHISRVQPLGHIHGGNARDGVTVHNGALHGRGTAQGGKQGAVDVDTAQRRAGKDRQGQDLAIGYHDDEVGRKRAQGVVKCTAAQGLGLVHGDAPLQRVGLDGRGGENVAASARLVGLGDNGNHVLAGLTKSAEGGNGKIGGAHKYDAHGVVLSCMG